MVHVFHVNGCVQANCPEPIRVIFISVSSVAVTMSLVCEQHGAELKQRLAQEGVVYSEHSAEEAADIARALQRLNTMQQKAPFN